MLIDSDFWKVIGKFSIYHCLNWKNILKFNLITNFKKVENKFNFCNGDLYKVVYPYEYMNSLARKI